MFQRLEVIVLLDVIVNFKKLIKMGSHYFLLHLAITYLVHAHKCYNFGATVFSNNQASRSMNTCAQYAWMWEIGRREVHSIKKIDVYSIRICNGELFCTSERTGAGHKGERKTPNLADGQVPLETESPYDQRKYLQKRRRCDRRSL